MGNKNFFLNSKAQSVVEYLFLMAVVVFIAMSFFRSAAFQNYFGEKGKFFETYRKQWEYSYRHGLPKGSTGDDLYHATYSPGPGESRFFSGRGAYPP